MRYAITHTTTYKYSDAVSVSHHIARLNPRPTRRQQCQRHALRIDPAPATTSEHIDYFGNAVTVFRMKGAHRQLQVLSQGEVEIWPAEPPRAWETPPWETIRDRLRSECAPEMLEAYELVFDSTAIKASPEFAAYAAESFPMQRPLLEAVVDLTRRIHADFTFDPKATSVATPLEEVFQTRRGVCQDFAQLQIACLRSLGLAARYVSGYLDSHAWVSVFYPGTGWIDVDPTNNVLPSTSHITLAWGRDYSDVSPLRGVILGGGEHSLKVAVDVMRQDG